MINSKLKNCLSLFLLCGILVLFFNERNFAQVKDLNLKFGKNIFKTKFNSEEYTTILSIYREDEKIFEETYYDLIPEIARMDLDNDGKKEYLIAMYSGGAHCCTSLFTGKISKGKFNYTDTIYWGNSFFKAEDLNSDGKTELVGFNDVYAYMFTNYAQSRFPVLIYGYENKRFVKVTSKFPKQINDNLTELKKELDEYKDFKCEEAGTETFNTDAGAVKAILAAATEDYMLLGRVEDGYNLINEFYKCPDRDSFKDTLRINFLLR